MGRKPKRIWLFRAALLAMVYLSSEAILWVGLLGVEKVYGIGYSPILDAGLSAEHRKIIARLVAGETE